MAEIRAFQAIRPKKGWEEKIAALPYDVFSLEEAAQVVEREPLSFLSIDRPELSGALLAEEPESAEKVKTREAGGKENISGKENPGIYEQAAALLKKRCREGYFIQDEGPCFYLYELTAEGRSQTGVGALTRVDDYLNGVICRHENTRAEKEEDRARHVRACRAQTGPLFLAYRSREAVTALVESLKERVKPSCDFTAKDGVRHRVWSVREAEEQEKLRSAFTDVDHFYIADGHHRCSAAVRYALEKREEFPHYRGDEPWNYLLSVLFADDQLKILDYNRYVRDLNGLARKQFLNRIDKCFDLEFMGNERVRPAYKGMFGMYLKEGWYALRVREEFLDRDPVEGLDTALLQKHALGPVLGIREPRTDKRIDFIGGVRGLSELEERVNAEGGAAFCLYPTSMEELFGVADAGRLMPPKSTWFEPKLRSGLLLYSLE